MTDYLEGALRRDRLDFERHLVWCSFCRDYLDQMRTTIALTGRPEDAEPRRRSASSCSTRSATGSGLANDAARVQVHPPGGSLPIHRVRLAAGRVGRGRGRHRPLRERHPRLPPGALPRWIDDELWLVELDEVEEEHDGVLIARRARLLERIEAWDAETSPSSLAPVQRVREVAERSRDPLVQGRAEMIAAIADGPDPSATALAMYTTAHTFDDVDGSYYQERRRQAAWLRDHLQLDTVATEPRNGQQRCEDSKA